MRHFFLTAVAALTITSVPAAAFEAGKPGLWIVVGTFRNPDSTTFQGEAVARASAAAKQCSLAPFNDFSGKFQGFAEGYDVVVVGPYQNSAQAQSVLGRVKRCVPGAYVKRATYLGE